MLTELFLAGKYLKPRRNAVSVITLISIIGVMLGVAVLMVVLAVMTGFTDLMKTKLLETQAHLRIYSPYGRPITNIEHVMKTAEKLGIRCAPIIQHPVLVQKDRRFDPRSVIGIDLESVPEEMNLKAAMRSGKLSLEKNEVLLSSVMASQFNLCTGDKILLHAPSKLAELVNFRRDGQVELNQDKSIYLPGEFTVAGIFSFGKYDFDRNVLFLGRDDAADLFGQPWGSASAVYGWVNDPFNMRRVLDELRDQLPGFAVTGWEESNRQLLGVLQVEKNMMFFLLVFIVLVAAFSITNTLITTVYQKTREIGLLKSLGASNRMVMNVFVLQGLLVGLIGSSCGILLGGTVLFFRNDILRLVSRITGQELFPKEFYFFNELPAHVAPWDIAFILITSVVLCTLGAMIPAYRAARLKPAEALRYE